MYYKVKDEKELVEAQKQVKNIPGKVLEHVQYAYIDNGILFLEMHTKRMNNIKSLDFSSEIELWKVQDVYVSPLENNKVYIGIDLLTHDGKRVIIRCNDLSESKHIYF